MYTGQGLGLHARRVASRARASFGERPVGLDRPLPLIKLGLLTSWAVRGLLEAWGWWWGGQASTDTPTP